MATCGHLFIFPYVGGAGSIALSLTGERMREMGARRGGLNSSTLSLSSTEQRADECLESVRWKKSGIITGWMQ